MSSTTRCIWVSTDRATVILASRLPLDASAATIMPATTPPTQSTASTNEARTTSGRSAPVREGAQRPRLPPGTEASRQQPQQQSQPRRTHVWQRRQRQQHSAKQHVHCVSQSHSRHTAASATPAMAKGMPAEAAETP